MKPLFSLFLVVFTASVCNGQHWMQWRGPLMTGEAPNAKPPTHWSETENIKWKTKLPGQGHSSPVLTDKYVFLTLAREIGKPFDPRPDTAPGAHDNKMVSSKFEFVGVAINRQTGTVQWEKVLHSAIPHEGAHVSASLASASPVTDGQRVWFFFGSYGLYCLDADGNQVWSKQLGTMNTKHGHGEGASPVLSGDRLAVNWDHEGQSFIVVMNKLTGQVLWKKERDEVTSWSSPIVVEHNGQKQLIVAGTNRIRAYDMKSGDVFWQCGGMSNNIVASPVYADGMVFVGSSYVQRQMLGIRLEGASGDITSTENVVWSRTARTPYVPSLLLADGHLYFLRHYQGVLTRLVAATGDEPTGPFRLRSMNEIYASPVAADGRIYVTDRSGTTAVITSSDQPQTIAVNRLNDRFNASAALAGDEFYLRGENFLYCIADDSNHEK